MNDSAPAISVLMPMRNGQPFLAEAIDSILNQTFQDWEFVIVDNCSTDGSAEYALERAATEPRIKVLRNDTNVGITYSLNRGLEACRGEWVARIDCDDRAMPERLERQLGFVRANPDVVVLSCFANYINAAGERIGRGPHDLISHDAYRRAMDRNEVIGILHPGALIKREAFATVGTYRTEYEPAEDTDLWNRLSEAGVVMVLPEYLMDYRLHSGSIVARQMRLGHLKREWVSVCMRSRRSGLAEPTWEEVQQRWATSPLFERLDRSRRLNVDAMLRQGRQDLAAGKSIAAYSRFAAAAIMRPGYSLPRVMRHLKPAALAHRRSHAPVADLTLLPDAE